MAERTAYSITLTYDDPRMLEAQQSDITAAGLDDEGNPLPNWGSSLAKLVRFESWANVSLDHRHEVDRIVSSFCFTTRLMEEGFGSDRVLEAAVFDIQAWIHEVGLPEGVLPSTVELRSSTLSEGISPHQDLTQEAIAIIGRISAITSVEIDDFKE